MGCGTSNQTYQGSKRGAMKMRAPFDEEFMQHHLDSESHLSKYASTDKIRRRQILQHLYIDQLNHKYQCDPVHSYFYVSCLLSSWMQRLFLENVEQMHEDYFNNGKSYDVSRERLADRYLFELYQFKEFLQSGGNKANDEIMKSLLYTLGLASSANNSDSSIFPILRVLKKKYPQVADNSDKKFPEVKDLKQDANLLKHFPSKYFSDLDFNNYKTLLHDLKYLFDKAFDQFNDFKTDMQDLLGIDVLADVKVKCIDKEQGRVYNASSTRRVLIKWVEVLLEKLPNAVYSYGYIKFLISKRILIDNFHAQATHHVHTTHNIIIQILLDLIEDIKCDSKTLKPEQNFGFYIYDLLRCKTHRPDGEGVVELIEKMKATKTTKTGKKLEVVRIKNRLKTPNRDIMVNFKYGDVIVAQAQLGIDTSDVSEKDKKTNKMNHYLYELERGLFGPTIELFMQYQDFNRSEIIVDLKNTGMVCRREKFTEEISQKTDRKCPNGHEMIGLHDNFFSYFKLLNQEQNNALTYSCDFCLTTELKFTEGFDYCSKCSLAFCNNCEQEYRNTDPNLMIYNIYDSIREPQSKAEYINEIKKNGYSVGVFYYEGSSASILSIDYLAYLNSLFKKRSNQVVQFVKINATSGWGKDFAKQIEVTRFPTFVAFDKDCQPRKRVIGASILHMDYFNEYAKLLKSNPSPVLQITCNFHPQRKLQAVSTQSLQDWKCRFCKNASNVDSISSFFKELSKDIFDKDIAYKCPQCEQLVCKYCAFLAFPEDINYLDVTGKSYLSYKPKKVSQTKCSNGHVMQLMRKNPFDSIHLNCNDCGKNFLFSEEEGMGYCKQCNVVTEPKCMGIENPKIQEDIMQREIVTHFAEMTACEADICTQCRIFMRKEYFTKYPVVKQRNHNQDQDSDVAAIEQYIDDKLSTIKWKCVVCTQEKDDGLLHLVCHGCKEEVCMSCAEQLKLFQAPQQKKQPQQINTNYICNHGHPIVKTSKAPDLATLKFTCESCLLPFYINTPNYFCQICNIRNCDLCGPRIYQKQVPNTCLQGHPLIQQVNNAQLYTNCSLNPNHSIIFGLTVYVCSSGCNFIACNPSKCQSPLQTCPKNHALRINRKVMMRHFCDTCMQYIEPISFDCKLCKYDKCFQCYNK